MEQLTTRRVVVSGALGQMGRTVAPAVAAQSDLEVVALVDPGFADPGAGGAIAGLGADVPRFVDLEAALADVVADVVVDFTHPGAVFGNVQTCLEHGVAAVVGTTGLDAVQLESLGRSSGKLGVPVFVAPNFALGAVLMMVFARQAAGYLDACEIVELHHDRKKDAPSGTAARTGQLVEEAWRGRGLERAVPLHSVRLPGLVAHQEVIFGDVGQTLTIRHDSVSRESFVPGVLLALRKVIGLEGLVVGLENIL